jgi:hypothetical protein
MTQAKMTQAKMTQAPSNRRPQNLQAKIEEERALLDTAEQSMLFLKQQQTVNGSCPDISSGPRRKLCLKDRFIDVSCTTKPSVQHVFVSPAKINDSPTVICDSPTVICDSPTVTLRRLGRLSLSYENLRSHFPAFKFGFQTYSICTMSSSSSSTMLTQVHTGLPLEAKDLEEPFVEHTVLHSDEESFQNQPSDMETTMTLAQGATTELKRSRTIGGMNVALDNSAGGGHLKQKTPKERKAQRKQIRLQLSCLFIAALVVCNLWWSDDAPAELTVSDLFGNYTSPAMIAEPTVSNRLGNDTSPAMIDVPTVSDLSGNATPPAVIATTDASPAMIATTENLWEDDSDVPPPWLKDYMEWHHDTRQKLNESNWQNYKYILLRCVEADDKCAGAADRLKMIPMQILLAEQAKRLFFIHWSRPAALEEFLVPPAGGLDWRLPAWLAEKIDANAAGPIWKMNAKGWRNNRSSSHKTIT